VPKHPVHKQARKITHARVHYSHSTGCCSPSPPPPLSARACVRACVNITVPSVRSLGMTALSCSCVLTRRSSAFQSSCSGSGFGFGVRVQGSDPGFPLGDLRYWWRDSVPCNRLLNIADRANTNKQKSQMDPTCGIQGFGSCGWGGGRGDRTPVPGDWRGTF
jgi:hypothetical protein